jgi:hypothetical protein
LLTADDELRKLAVDGDLGVAAVMAAAKKREGGG